MISNPFSKAALTVLVMIVLVWMVAGCQTTTIPTGAIEADKAIAAGVCSVWLPVTWSSRDTAETALQVRRNNAARDGYCE